jgi:class 3 adenylate cyclase/pimeloyl-ACP methyl ester carboxylesterase
VDVSSVRYARSGEVAIAFAVQGEGPVDLVFVHGFAGNLDFELESPYWRRFHDRLASFSRSVLFDRRGSGLSDRMREAPTLETRMDDLRAVLDAVGSESAVLFGTFEAASMCLLFAATYPERTRGLVLYNPVAKGSASPDYPWAEPPEALRGVSLDEFVASWGSLELATTQVRAMGPSFANDAEFVRSIARSHRLGASPGAALTIRRMAADVDVRDILPAIRVPTLVLNMPASRGEAEYVTARIPRARRIEAPGPDYFVYLLGDPVYDEIEAFVGSLHGEHDRETVLATVLFTDIVGSTAKAAQLGDRAWADLVRRHHSLVRSLLDRFRGRELDTAGDGFFAAFDGPIRAIGCATTITTSVRDLGLQVRAGLHTGECETIGAKLGGLAVNIGARVAAQAPAGEVLVTSTVKDLVAGSNITFEDRGTAELKGIPGKWHLYAVTSRAAKGEPDESHA